MQNEEYTYSEPVTSAAHEPREEFEAQNNPTPDNPPWNSGIAVLVWLASVLLIVFMPVIFLGPYIFKHLREYPNFQETLQALQFDPTAVLLQVISVYPAHLLTLLLAWLVVTRKGKFSFRQTLGWDWESFRWWNYLIIFGGIFVLAAVVQNFFPAQDNELEKMLRVSHTIVYLVAFLATFTAPVVEEVIYRGVLYSSFQRTFGTAKGVFITTALFALIHVPQYYPSYSTIFMICLLSLILTLIRAKTKNLLPCIIFHTIFNGIQSIILVVSTFYPQDSPVPPPDPAALLKLFW